MKAVDNDNTRSANDNSRGKRSKRAERTRDRQNRTARSRSAPQDDDRYGSAIRDPSSAVRDASGATVRTYNMEGGGRVTVYQRGSTMQVGDRVDFGDSPRSRRRGTAERERAPRYEEASEPRERGFGEFFFR
jgi:hypothetical protein